MFSRIIIFTAVVFLSFGTIAGIYSSWRKGIEREALLEYNQHQLEENIKDQDILKNQLEAINNKQKEVEAANLAEKKALKDKLESINISLDTKEAIADDRPASNILKKTIGKLKDVVK